MEEKRVKGVPPVCRSILAIPFEVDGKPRGVIVLESQNPREIRYRLTIYERMAKTCKTLFR